MKAMVTAVVLMTGIALSNVALGAGDPKAGEVVFNHVCKMCHGTGMMGAPKVGDKEAWAPRIKQGIDKLTQHALNGIRKMPPRGTCKACSDEDIANAVAYLISRAK